MDIETEVEPRAVRVPAWYWAVAGLCLLFELAGCYAYLVQVTVDPATLPVDHRMLAEAMPVWAVAAYALAVWVGLAGAIGLILRRRFARGALFLSMLFVIIQFGGLMLVPAIRGSMSSSQLLGPILIFALSYGYWQCSKIAWKRGWLA